MRYPEPCALLGSGLPAGAASAPRPLPPLSRSAHRRTLEADGDVIPSLDVSPDAPSDERAAPWARSADGCHVTGTTRRTNGPLAASFPACRAVRTTGRVLAGTGARGR